MTRNLFGAPLGDLQLSQAAIADSATDTDASALLVYRAAWTKDKGAGRVTSEAAMAKMFATESAQRVIDRAVQMFGGQGVRKGVKVEELYREIRALRIYEGATEVQKIVIAREALKSARRICAKPRSKGAMIASAHIDTFTRDNLPPRNQWPEFLFARGSTIRNGSIASMHCWIAGSRTGEGDRLCLISPDETLTYAQLAERVNRIANVLTRDFALVPGNRVLLRGPNNPMMVASILAVIKAGGVVVATMPLLRAKELSYAVGKARIALALCDMRLADDMEKTKPLASALRQIVYWGDTAQGSLESLMMRPGYENFTACDTASDDVCLIGFTSGTTGEPKGTMHFHRDMLATCDSYGRHVLRPTADDRFIGSPPLAFTFGLGGLVLFPLRVGASTILLEKAPPDELLSAIAKWRATICFTAPTAYRAMLGSLASHDISSLKKCVSAGEALPLPTFEAWHKATGIRIMDGIGATEMLHIFIGSPDDEIRAGSTGRACAGLRGESDR